MIYLTLYMRGYKPQRRRSNSDVDVACTLGFTV